MDEFNKFQNIILYVIGISIFLGEGGRFICVTSLFSALDSVNLPFSGVGK